MTNTNATNFRKNIFEYLNQAVEYNDVINVTTKNGNAVVLSEADYNSLLETVYLMSHPATREHHFGRNAGVIGGLCSTG